MIPSGEPGRWFISHYIDNEHFNTFSGSLHQWEDTRLPRAQRWHERYEERRTKQAIEALRTAKAKAKETAEKTATSGKRKIVAPTKRSNAKKAKKGNNNGDKESREEMEYGDDKQSSGSESSGNDGEIDYEMLDENGDMAEAASEGESIDNEEDGQGEEGY